jgi:methylmalonyl-CoA mutase N-terminal domain/subunit
MRQYAGFGSAVESNARYRYLLAQGTTGLSVAFDLPTQLGLDPDDPLARGEVGKVGVSISTLDDMRRLFHDIRSRRHHLDDHQRARDDAPGALHPGRRGAGRDERQARRARCRTTS